MRRPIKLEDWLASSKIMWTLIPIIVHMLQNDTDLVKSKDSKIVLRCLKLTPLNGNYTTHIPNSYFEYHLLKLLKLNKSCLIKKISFV